MVPRINSKIKGVATQRLFAAVCEAYCVEEAKMADKNNIPKHQAIFGFLSRVRLVREVMVGVLCEDEPLPRDTVQHTAAYKALIGFLQTMIDNEIKASEAQAEVPEGESLAQKVQEMRDDFHKTVALRAKARRVKKKLGKDGANSDSKYRNLSKDRIENLRQILFSGDRIPLKVRRKVRKSLNGNDRQAFFWQMLVDDSIQEQSAAILYSLPPLSHACMDFRSCDFLQWVRAIELILYATHNFTSKTPIESATLDQPIKMICYSDPSAFGLIQLAQENTQLLRTIFDNSWDPDSVGDDQCCIFAVCTDDVDQYVNKEHCSWLKDFLARAHDIGLQLKRRGSYQQRLELYKELRASHVGEGMKSHFFSVGC